MKIEQEKTFRPVTITLETAGEFIDFVNILKRVTNDKIPTFFNTQVDFAGQALNRINQITK